MRAILADVANLFQSNMQIALSSIRFNPSQLQLKDWKVLKVTGADRETFFQGQVTNDLAALSLNHAQLTARLNRTGKVQSFFFIAKLSDCLLLLCPEALEGQIQNDFEKFIIMDDVVIEEYNKELWLIFNSFLMENVAKDASLFALNFYGLDAILAIEPHPTMVKTNESELETVRILNGWPKWGEDVTSANFINDSKLNELAISYKKGCFLGQETVAKIENNRGAAYFPMLLKIDNGIDLSASLKKDFTLIENGEKRKVGTLLYQIDNFLQVLLLRDYRVVGRRLELKLNNTTVSAVVDDLPFFKSSSRQDLALELYHQGVEIFQSNDLEGAMTYMQRALAFDPALADAYETLGVMLGRIGSYEEAISWMDRLLTVNPHSVMAHTNKSLFLMKLGKIEEAEAEKGLATVKSFAVYGQEAKLKKQLEEEKKRKEDDIFRRQKMFQQVLEMDEEDTIALYGMADIYFQRKEFNQSIVNLEKVIAVDSNYSTAYLLLGKAYEAVENRALAIRTYQAGILVASKRGDMMPANEMQSRLNQLVMSSGLL